MITYSKKVPSTAEGLNLYWSIHPLLSMIYTAVLAAQAILFTWGNATPPPPLLPSTKRVKSVFINPSTDIDASHIFLAATRRFYYTEKKYEACAAKGFMAGRQQTSRWHKREFDILKLRNLSKVTAMIYQRLQLSRGVPGLHKGSKWFSRSGISSDRTY